MNNEQIPNNANMSGGIPNLVPPAPANPMDNGMGMTPPVAPPQPVNMGIGASTMEPVPSVQPGTPTVPPVQTEVSASAVPPVQTEVVAPVVPPAPSGIQPDMGGAPSAPNPNMNLNPFGVVETPAATVAPEPSVSPLMSTPLTANTNLNPTPPVSAAPPQPGVLNGMPGAPGMVPPGMDGAPGVPMPNMGIPTPPQAPINGGKEKKPLSMPLIIALVVILVLAVGVGVWFVLFGSKSKVPAIEIIPFVKNVELGATIDTTSASSFATIRGISPSECTVSTTLNTNLAKTYEYTITCGGVSSGTQEVVVSDTLAPVVVLKDVVVVPNTEVNAKDFVESIEDASIEESSEYARFVQEVNTTAEGTFQVELEFTDLYGNSTTETGTLIVDVNAPDHYYICNSDGESGEKLNYRFGISSDSYIYDAVKVVTFTYTDEASYNEAVEAYNTSNSINGITGKASFDLEHLQISLKVNLTLESLPDEFGTDYFEEEFDVQSYFGDSCETE